LPTSSDVLARAPVKALDTRLLSPHVGVEVIGLDFDQPVSAAVEQQLQALWVEFGLVLFRGGAASEEAHLRLSGCFGPLQASAHGTKGGFNARNELLLDVSYNPDRPERANSIVYRANGQDRAGYIGWHWDQSFMPKMVHGGALRMIEPSAQAGETGFIDAIGAYRRLPERLKARIEGLEVVYAYTTRMETNRYGFPADFDVVRRADNLKLPSFEPVVHPLVFTQPQTGRKVLNLSPMHCKHILGVSAEESDEILREVTACLTDEAFAYFHKWAANDVIVWDNWRIIHQAAGVPPECRRRAVRTTITGDYGLGRYLDPAADEAAAPTPIGD